MPGGSDADAPAVLALNAGSSSIKFALFRAEAGAAPALLAKGTMASGDTGRVFTAKDAAGATLAEGPEAAGMTGAARHAALLGWIDGHLAPGRLAAAGHRIVHGGRDFVDPVLLTAATLAALDRLTPLAPLHQPPSLDPVRILAALRPSLLQVGCFDTAFHATLDPVVRRYALPRRFEADGIRKYGFHGLSYEHVAGRLAEIAPDLARGRTVVAHLGSGASLCAIRDGRSVDTTMGFSALDGLVMASRCGALDPGVILYLQTQLGLGVEEVEDMLYHRSGLAGLSESDGDMRALLRSGDPTAREAIDLFAFRAAREAAAMANTLEGLDALVFTGGIGEHQPDIRRAICDRLRWLGVELDSERNAAGAERISRDGSRVTVLVVAADEERVIARHALDAMR